MAGSGRRIAVRKIVSEVLRPGYMLQASGSTLGSAMMWTLAYGCLRWPA
jgi:hypothetical protein